MSDFPKLISDAGGSYKRLLVGLDGSAPAQNALCSALALAAALHGEVRALLVVSTPAHAETNGELEQTAEEESRKVAGQVEEAAAAVGAGLTVSLSVVFSDSPARALAHYAREHAFDLIVVGGHGREQITHGGIGRSLEALLHDHPCPLLVV
jgi:nucleotide-binding universal stress UspA family protein